MASKPTGNPPGRPRKYKTAEEVGVVIDKYFASCDERDKPYTIYGLSLALGLDRKALIEYQGQPEFSNTIKVAKDKVRLHVEERMMSGQQNVAGLIFWLKNNAAWADKQEVEHKGNMSVDINIQGWSDAEDTKE